MYALKSSAQFRATSIAYGPILFLSRTRNREHSVLEVPRRSRATVRPRRRAWNAFWLESRRTFHPSATRRDAPFATSSRRSLPQWVKTQSVANWRIGWTNHQIFNACNARRGMERYFGQASWVAMVFHHHAWPKVRSTAGSRKWPTLLAIPGRPPDVFRAIGFLGKRGDKGRAADKSVAFFYHRALGVSRLQSVTLFNLVSGGERQGGKMTCD